MPCSSEMTSQNLEPIWLPVYASSKVVVSNTSSLCRWEQTGQGAPIGHWKRCWCCGCRLLRGCRLLLLLLLLWRGVALARTALAALDVNKFAHCRKRVVVVGKVAVCCWCARATGFRSGCRYDR
jgi:hypothetical protein